MYDENSDYGAVLEVDIEYSKELESKHKDLTILSTKKENKQSTQVSYNS